MADKAVALISPRRGPPSRERPSVGCLVKTAQGLARGNILSMTMCSFDETGRENKALSSSPVMPLVKWSFAT